MSIMSILRENLGLTIIVIELKIETWSICDLIVKHLTLHHE